jgi:hypothetical protein
VSGFRLFFGIGGEKMGGEMICQNCEKSDVSIKSRTIDPKTGKLVVRFLFLGGGLLMALFGLAMVWAFIEDKTNPSPYVEISGYFLAVGLLILYIGITSFNQGRRAIGLRTSKCNNCGNVWENLPDGSEMTLEEWFTRLKEGDDTVREWAAKALGERGDPKAIEPLIEAANENNFKVIKAAKEAILKFGDDAVEPLIHALKHTDVVIKMYAATLLGDIGNENAVGPLEGVLNDEDKHLRKSAEKSLKKIHRGNK